MSQRSRERLYEGKAKVVYATDDPGTYLVHFKDDATAFNGKKKAVIERKGEYNAAITAILFRYLEKRGIATHFYEVIGERDMLVRKLDMIPVEVVVRNQAAGSLAERLGLEEGTALSAPVLEFYLKNDALNDPMINGYHIQALGLARDEVIRAMERMALRINRLLLRRMENAGIRLVDFKLEFGTDGDGRLRLGDEISPDSCRFWDMQTGERLDKDRFRRDMGGVESAYAEILRRLQASSPDGGLGKETESLNWQADVNIRLKDGVLDPAGEAARRSLNQIGFTDVSHVTIGKWVSLSLEAEDEIQARSKLKEMCERLLVNPVLENYEAELYEMPGEAGKNK